MKGKLHGLEVDKPLPEIWAVVITQQEEALRLGRGEKNPTVEASRWNKKGGFGTSRWRKCKKTQKKTAPQLCSKIQLPSWIGDLPNIMASTAPPAQNSIRICNGENKAKP